MTILQNSQLGKVVEYATRYDPALLFSIARAEKRAELGIDTTLPFIGVDIWNAYELSWLNGRGKPRVALAEIRVPATSTHIIESKSFKLYLNGFTQTTMADSDSVRQTLIGDLSAAAGAPVTVVLSTPTSPQASMIENLEGELIDDLAIAIDHYGPPRADFLAADPEVKADETLVSHLLKSNCPVTGQPDWASVQVRYQGPRISREGLIRYLVSYRQHSDFHEQCVERIFLDILSRCTPLRLSVYARYTRRGGLDINPFRSTPGGLLPGNTRTARQ